MKKYTGFSLIELMIVVAIVAIISAIAVPSYNSYVIQGKRAEGRAFALNLASLQENYFQQYSKYTSEVKDKSGLSLGSNKSESSLYDAVVTVPTSGVTFTITLTPTFTDATCSTLTLTNTGVKGPVGCW